MLRPKKEASLQSLYSQERFRRLSLIFPSVSPIRTPTYFASTVRLSSSICNDADNLLRIIPLLPAISSIIHFVSRAGLKGTVELGAYGFFPFSKEGILNIL